MKLTLVQLRIILKNCVNALESGLLSIETDSKVIVTTENYSFFNKGAHEIKLGELCENSSREVTQKIYSGKKIKARLCDFRPSFLSGYKGDPAVMISIWEN